MLVTGGVVLALGAPPQYADAILCRAKNDAVFVRDTCKRKETPVDLVKGDAGPKGASSLRAHVVDAAGRTIGHLTAFGEIVMREGDIALRAHATVDGFIQFSGLYFPGASCSGTPLVTGLVTLYQPLAVVGTSGYYAGDPIVRRSLASAMTQTTAPNCVSPGQTYDAATGMCCSTFVTLPMLSAGPAIPFDIGGFTPPFRVEIER